MQKRKRLACTEAEFVLMAYHSISAAIFGVLKWPIAIISIVSVPALALVLLDTIHEHVSNLRWLLLGFGAYYLFWRVFLKRLQNQWFSTFEHEVTHCIFATAMGNRVTGMRVTAAEGGHMQYIGTPSWLIDVAPYFFPTITVTALIILPWVPTVTPAEALFIIGVTVAYHLTSTWVETHAGQSDIQKAGFIFSALFLPGANIACFTIVLNVALYGWSGINDWYDAVLSTSLIPFANI